MVPSAAVFAFDDCSSAVIELLRERPQTPAELLAVLGDRFSPAELWDTLERAVPGPRHRGQAARPPAPKIMPLAPMPIQTLVVNVTNQCNLSLRVPATSTARTRSSTPRTAASPSS